jgi:PAS domain S-box-containing protein
MSNKVGAHRLTSWCLQMGGVGLAYFLCATLGLRLAVPATNATPIWIPTGIAIAAVLRFGPRAWPAILLGAFAANAWFLAGLGLPTAQVLGVAFATSLGNTAEALLAGWLIKRVAGTRSPFGQVSHVLWFILLAASLATLVSALLGSATFCAVSGQWPLFRSMSATWWLGDAAGALVVTPLLMTFHRAKRMALPRATHRDALLAGGLSLGFWFGLCPLMPPLAFLFLPLLVLGTFRLGSFYSSALVALLAILATASTVMGHGPFILAGSRLGSLLLQQGFICTLGITNLVLSAALQERRALEARLTLHNRLYRTLSGVNQAIVHAEDRATLLQDTCRFLVELGGFRMAWAGFQDEASGRMVPEASAGYVEGYLDEITPQWAGVPDGRGPSDQAVSGDRGVILQDCQNDPDFAPWRSSALSRGYQTSCSLPIRQGGTVFGVLVAYHGEPNLIGPEEGNLLEELAGDLGYALGALETKKDLVESERRLRTTLENAKLLAVSLAADGTITFCNNHMLRLAGWAREEVLGRNYFQLFLPPEIRQDVQAKFTSSLQFGEDPLYHENEILTRSNGRRMVQWNNTILRDREEAVIGTVSLGEDITDRKLAQEALSQRVGQLSALNELGTRLSSSLELAACAQAALEGIFAAVSPDLALLFLREGEALRLLNSMTGPRGLERDGTPTHLVGQCLCGLAVREGQTLYSVDITQDLRCTWDECKRAGVKSFAVLPLKNGDEVIGVLGLASTLQRDFRLQSSFLETLAAQVSTGIQNALLHQRLKAHADDLERFVEERTALLREANEDLAKAAERAMAADRAKSGFLSAMSHELRTPLNSVIGFTGVLLGGMAGPLQPQQVEPLRIVQRNGRHLLELINDVLDLSKIEAAEMRLASLPYDLVQTVRESLESMAPAAAAKGLTLSHAFRVEHLALTGDRQRVAQILLNLLSNAVKFTETGTVTVRLSTDPSHATISVQDTGLGIAPHDLPRLFREFEQLDAGLARHSEGTGLGLALSRRLARLLKGDIVAESQLGQGSTFTLILPLPTN